MIDTNRSFVLDDLKWSIGENADGLFIKRDQYISDEFLQRNADLRFESKAPAKNFHMFASVPEAVVDKWMREGFNIYDGSVSVKDIVKKLKQEDLTAFLTSNKSL